MTSRALRGFGENERKSKALGELLFMACGNDSGGAVRGASIAVTVRHVEHVGEKQ